MIRSLVLSAVTFFNFISRKLSLAVKGGYQLMMPFATYAPWLQDPEFLKIYNQVKKDSLVPIFQCWELWQLVEDTQKLKGDVIEIGTYRGASGAIMATKLKLTNSQDTLYCCDTYEGIVKASEEDNYFKGGELKDTSLDTIKQRFANDFKLNNTVFLKGIFPEDTGHEVADNTFRLVHIDVDVYLSAKDTVEWVWDRMSVGGIIVFNDYAYPRTVGITKLVNEYRSKKDCAIIHNFNGNGIMIKCQASS